jgi:protein-L-isoaspartate(D-aspartate) O-methyltransferase
VQSCCLPTTWSTLYRAHKDIELVRELSARDAEVLYGSASNIELKIANGYHGWSEHAPFDKVIVTAAPDLIPPPLIHQLKAGGKMVVPAGLPDAQQLVLVEKHSNGRVTMREILQVRFSQLEDTEPS